MVPIPLPPEVLAAQLVRAAVRLRERAAALEAQAREALERGTIER